MTMINVRIYDPVLTKCYELMFSANTYKEALVQAEIKVKPWDHVVRGFGSDVSAEGKRK